MKVLYYSVHAVLEYDEIMLLHDLGHDVFSLGLYFNHKSDGRPRPDLHIRPRPPFSTDPALLQKFDETNCTRSYPNSVDNTWLSIEFLREFDVFIVMHDAVFIEKNWEFLRHIPVVWRTIGQGLDVFEALVKRPRESGLLIVRYSPFEERAQNYAGANAIIRFYRDEALYGPWNGHRKSVIHYTTSFKRRYPLEYGIFLETLHGIDYVLGSGGNEDNPHCIGQNSYDDQRQTFRDHFAYFYCCAFEIPYNLAFVEGLISGTPMVVFHEHERQTSAGRYYEVPYIIEHGVSGLVVHSQEEGRAALKELLCDQEFASSISAAGRAKAVDLFGMQVARTLWTRFLASL